MANFMLSATCVQQPRMNLHVLPAKVAFTTDSR